VHTEKVGKNLLILAFSEAFPISSLFWHVKFYNPGMPGTDISLFLQPGLHPRVVSLTFSVCADMMIDSFPIHTLEIIFLLKLYIFFLPI
jgi:hypothetical protein